ncbi:MAG: DUF4149 domain-containing protein [Pyrinomonadaceae bacterium]|nr:DUF4149 domain-containing protein [Pyrinomonadaceae bacterium]
MSLGVEEAGARAVGTKTSDETQAVAQGGALARALTDVRLLLIALWLGAAVFFSAAVAPSAFGVLRAASVPQANHLAGSIVTRTLAIINTGGFIISLLLLATAFLFRETAKRRPFVTEIIALVVVAVTTALGQWGIAARMLSLRQAMGRPIDDVPAGDSLRVAFASLHGLSVMALTLGMIAAIVALLLIARRGRA